MSQNKEEKSCQSKSNRTHLTLEKRKLLKECLVQGMNQLEIASILNVNKTTITREILAHRKEINNNRKIMNPIRLCENRQSCEIKHICKSKKCITKCKNCQYGITCINICPSFSKIICKRQNRFPYVCDGCKKINSCVLTFFRYDPVEADKESRLTLSFSRRGINMTQEEFATLDAILVEGTKKGQSVEHIVSANDLSISPRTIRRYISEGYTTTKTIDTPRGVSYRPRKIHISKEQQYNIKKSKIGRTLADFLNFAQNNSFLLFSQMDTVEGKKSDVSSKRLLTIILVRVRLFYCMPINSGSPESVVSAFNELYRTLGKDDYKFMFGVLVTDNGMEFSNVSGIERDPNNNEIRSRIFFCNPYASWEKGAIEVCHELLRRIIPKGTSLANITTAKTDLINSHINSYFRDSNNGLCAYDTFVQAFGDRGLNILKKLHIERIESNNVIIHPSLIKN